VSNQNLSAISPLNTLVPLIDEDFSDANGSTPPPGWTIEVTTGDPAVDQWRFDNPGERTVPDVLSNPFAIFDSDFVSNNEQPENVALVTPVFDASDESQVFLQFDQQYLGLIDPQYGSEGLVEVYNGTEWVPIATQLNDVIGTTRLDISAAAAGVENAQVRFRWTGNWSYHWALDNVKVVDELTPGITVGDNPLVSEDNVPDPLRFQFTLNSKPTDDVTISFSVDEAQLQPIASLTFTPDNWNIPQTARVEAVSDDIDEGNDQKSNIDITVSSADPTYNNFDVPDAIATITENVIPGFTSYRTVESTYRDLSQIAANNASLASWVDIGDSYDKTAPGGSEGYDLYALELGNKEKSLSQDKPVLFVQGSLHAREYTTAEAVTRFAESLMAGYGVDADTTWLLDFVDIRLVSIANPDGRKFAEQGYSWRKNTNPNVPAGEEPAPFPNYGVDLNRNYGSKWGEVEGGASTNPADLTYQGPSPFSEPESQALRDYLLNTFPDQKGPEDFDPASPDTSGVYLDLHSYGNLILYPFGWTNERAPNYDGLRNLGLKLGYFTGIDGEAYDVQQAIGLYPTSGTTDDWVYDTFGTAAYTLELGTEFFQPSEDFEETIAPEVLPALFYAAKSAHRPYQTSDAPDVVSTNVSLPQAVVGVTETVVLRAQADGTRYNDGNGNSNGNGITEGLELPTPQNVTGGRYSINAPSWVEGTETFEMELADGTSDSPTEALLARIDVTNLSVGRHTVFVEAKDGEGNYGVPTAVFLDVLEAPEAANVILGTNDKNNLTSTQLDTNDVIYAFGGDDTANGKAGNDLILMGDGADTANGNRGNDVIYGGRGADKLSGSAGNDKLYGEGDDDLLFGGEGDDLLWGGAGNDILQGGAGADTFVLAFNQGKDLIRDFQIGEDKLGLAGTLRFDQLNFVQEGQSALIAFGRDVLAQLNNVTIDQLTADVFTNVAPTA
jgi:Ca2+-binding RTX toxin-like protein